MNDKLPTIIRLLPHQLVLAEQSRNVWHVNLSNDAPMLPDDFLKAECYAHVAKQLNKGDHLQVLAEDGEWYAEFVIRSIEGSAVQVGEILYKEFEASGLIAEDYDVEWAGQREKARVIRKSDRRVMVSGLPSKEAATGWLLDRAARAPAKEAA